MVKRLFFLLVLPFIFTACDDAKTYLIRDAKSVEVYKQIVAYGVISGLKIQYQDPKEGLLAFITGTTYYPRTTQLTERAQQQLPPTQPGTVVVVNNQNEKNNNESQAGKDQAPDSTVSSPVPNQPLFPQEYRSMKESTITEMQAQTYENGFGVQVWTENNDTKILVKTFGANHPSDLADQMVDHLSRRWKVSAVKNES